MIATAAPRTAPETTRVLSRGGHACRWIEQHCVHTKGRWYGKPFRILPWQRRFVAQALRVDENGIRCYREMYLRVPKKNGKTELAAALACYFAAADREPAPEVYCAANSDEQADLVFGAAKTMCEVSPTLSKITERYAKEIHFRRGDGTTGKIHRLSATVGTNDGLNVSHAIFDELHEFTATKGEAMYNVVTNGVAARLEPVILEISTAGYDPESLESRKYEYGKRVNSGEIDDPSFLFVNYEAPKGADYRDLAAWGAANPSWGITILPAYAEQQIRSKPEGTVRRYNLNQQTEVENLWLPVGAWDACRVEPFEFDPDVPLYVGWDGGRSFDATAIACGQMLDGRLHLKVRVWERPINPANGQPVEGWRVPAGEVIAHLHALHDAYTLAAVAYDPWGIRLEASELEAQGFPMVEVPQTNARIIPTTAFFYELILNQRIAHDGDATFARHMRNAATHQTPTGIKLDKGRARRPMDAASAVIDLLYELMNTEELEDDEPSIGVSS